jgi:hypothetical protein
MDAFEEIVAGLFRRNGFWTWQGYKVKLTPEDKRAIGKPSMPRPEIDVLAYRPSENQLLWIECKSYLDSLGVTIDGFNISDGAPSRFKVFTSKQYRDVVSFNLIEQLSKSGLILPYPQLKYCLVAGKVHERSRAALVAHFQQNGWLLYDEVWIRERLAELSGLGYEDDVAIIVAKLFHRAKVKE